MVIQIHFGKGNVTINPSDIEEVQAPNRHGGIGKLMLNGRHLVWTGQAHIVASEGLGIHIGDITEVETRSNGNESDEKWVSHWRDSGGQYTQERYLKLGNVLRELKERGE